MQRTGDTYDEFTVNINNNNTANDNKTNRDGLIGRDNNSSTVLQIEFNYSGELLCIIIDSCSTMLLYNILTKKSIDIETNIREPSYICWNQNSNIVALGSKSGQLYTYNANTMKSQSINTKHNKRIICGAWSNTNILALASTDRTMTISNDKGETIEQVKLKYDPFDLQFNEQKHDTTYDINMNNSDKSNDNTISVNMGRSTILLYNLTDGDNPIELAFQSKYGDIESYVWYGDGYIVIGFSKGYVIAISTHMSEIGEELQSLKLFESSTASPQQLKRIVVHEQIHKIACISQNSLKIIDTSDSNNWCELTELTHEYTREDGEPESIQFTADGAICTVSTNNGYVYNYIITTSELCAVDCISKSNVAYMNSLKSVTVTNIMNSSKSCTIDVSVEPSILSLSSSVLACGLNNHIWYYTIPDTNDTTIKMTSYTNQNQHALYDTEYLGSVKQIKLNQCNIAAVLTDNGKLHIHTLSVQSGNDRVHYIYPDERSDDLIVTFDITDQFLVYATNKGTVVQYCLLSRDTTVQYININEYKHTSTINTVYCNNNGTRVLIIDNSSKGYVYSPVDNTKIEIQQFSKNAVSVLYDTVDNNILITIDPTEKQIVTYCYTDQSIKGTSINKLGSSKLPSDIHPLQLTNGELYGYKQSVSGSQITSFKLSTHDQLNTKQLMKSSVNAPDKYKPVFIQYVALNRLSDAYDVACNIQQKELFIQLGRIALEQMDLNVAVQCYTQLNDYSTLFCIHQLQRTEEYTLLCGSIAELQHDFNRAQTLYLSSTQPLLALHMRCHLLQYSSALKLASTLDASLTASICIQYGKQLEIQQDYTTALTIYQQAQQSCDSKQSLVNDQQLQEINSGLIRMYICSNQVKHGKQMAVATQNKQLIKQCAQLLYKLKLEIDAAELYNICACHEKSAQIYIKHKLLLPLKSIMPNVTTPVLHSQYGKLLEANNQLHDAIQSYQQCYDMDSCVRLYLSPAINQPEQAFELVRRHTSVNGAKYIVDYCKLNKLYHPAIEFLVKANMLNDAYEFALTHDSMDHYQSLLNNKTHQLQYIQLAQYYQSQNRLVDAGKSYLMAQQYQPALELLLDSNHPEHSIPVLIQLIEHTYTNDDTTYIQPVAQYLLNNATTAQTLLYLYQFYLIVHKYTEAGIIAIQLSNHDIASGNYNSAHTMLATCIQVLNNHQIIIPSELELNLCLLQSYRLAKQYTKQQNHTNSAHLLLRLSQHIHKFTTHTVPILTSCVIACQRSGMKHRCYQYACLLMSKQYRDQVDDKYRKAMDTFVRHPNMDQNDVPVESTQCLYCTSNLAIDDLHCNQCSNNIPFCVTTGYHMTPSQYTRCEQCKFPSLYDRVLNKIKSGDTACSMCGVQQTLEQIKVVPPSIKPVASEEKTN